jgi:NAD+ kinase
VTSVVVVAHQERAEAAALAVEACEWLAARGHKAWLLPDDAEALGLRALASDADPASADLALSLGGDGTVLRTVELVDGVPLLGVNVGQLGYLTEVEPHALTAALGRWLDGRYTIEGRMLLEIVVRRAGAALAGPERFRALNEAVIEKRESGHTVRLLVSIDGTPFTSYATDGLIVATPTGSTAYSLSARGPIVSPQHRAILLTPVSPHMLFDRSLVLDPSEPVTIEVLGHRPADLSVDGRRVAGLLQGDRVTCGPDPDVARFVRFGGRRFHQILKSKFGLSDR